MTDLAKKIIERLVFNGKEMALELIGGNVKRIKLVLN